MTTLLPSFTNHKGKKEKYFTRKKIDTHLHRTINFFKNNQIPSDTRYQIPVHRIIYRGTPRIS